MVPLLKQESSLIFSHLRDERGHGVHARARRVVHERAVLEVDSHLALVHLDFNSELNNYCTEIG